MSRSILLAITLLALAACGDDDDTLPCDELATICPSCPSDADGLVAKRSCELTAERGAEIDCQARLDDRSYEPQGCQYP
jgi:hypothetical protein